MMRAGVCLMAIMGLLACGGAKGPIASSADGNKPVKVGDGVDINGDGQIDGVAVDQDNDGTIDGVDLDGDGSADALLPGETVPGLAGGDGGVGDGKPGSDGNGSPDAGPGGSDSQSNDKDAGDDPPLVLEIPIAKVPCGDSECAISDSNVCCSSWSPSSGFGSTFSCIKQPACVIDYPFEPGLYGQDLISEPRAVVSLCDGAEDCSAGQVCCLVRLGVPLSDDLGKTWTGPGAGRQCMNADACSDEGAANGVPTGVASCNDDSDCRKIDGTTCKSEESNSATTGKGITARSYVKVCR